MSKVKIQGNASGTGTLTIQAPNTNTDRTIILPDEDVTLGGGGGKVLQVVNDTYGTTIQQTSTSTWTDSGLSASITPSATTSKVLVMISLYIGTFSYPATANGENEYGWRIKRAGTAIHETNANGFRFISYITSGYNMGWGIKSIIYLDTPSTTSATAYTVEGIMNNGDRMDINQAGTPSQMTLMEIGA